MLKIALVRLASRAEVGRELGARDFVKEGDAITIAFPRPDRELSSAKVDVFDPQLRSSTKSKPALSRVERRALEFLSYLASSTRFYGPENVRLQRTLHCTARGSVATTAAKRRFRRLLSS